MRRPNLTERMQAKAAEAKKFKDANFEMPFGKHKGSLLGNIAIDYPSYIVWLDQNDVFKIDPGLLEYAIENCEHPEDLPNHYTE